MKLFATVGAFKKDKERQNVTYNYNGADYTSKSPTIAALEFMKLGHNKTVSNVYILSLKGSSESAEQLKDSISKYDPLIKVYTIELPQPDIYFFEMLSIEIDKVINSKDEVAFEVSHGGKATSFYISSIISYLVERKDINLIDLFYLTGKPGQKFKAISNRELMIQDKWNKASYLFNRSLDSSALIEFLKTSYLSSEIKDCIEYLEKIDNAIHSLQIDEIYKLLTEFINKVEGLISKQAKPTGNFYEFIAKASLEKTMTSFKEIRGNSITSLYASFPLYLFDKKRYIHSVIFAYESFLTLLLKKLPQKLIPFSRDDTPIYKQHQYLSKKLLDHRPNKIKNYISEFLGDYDSNYIEAFDSLKKFRNQMSHGNIDSQSRSNAFVKENSKVHQTLKKIKQMYDELSRNPGGAKK